MTRVTPSGLQAVVRSMSSGQYATPSLIASTIELQGSHWWS